MGARSLDRLKERRVGAPSPAGRGRGEGKPAPIAATGSTARASALTHPPPAPPLPRGRGAPAQPAGPTRRINGHPIFAAAGATRELDFPCRILVPIARYVASRIEHGHFRPVPDLAIAARLVLETSVTWAVHRHWDPQPQPMDDALAEEVVVHFLVGALVAGA